MRCIYIISIFIFFFTYRAAGFDLDEASFNLAEKLLTQKKYSAAIEEFNSFTGKFPDSVYYNNAVIDKARIYFILKDYDNSIACYTILENNARNENDRKTALFGKGEIYYKQKLWDKAAESFKIFSIQYKNSPARHAALYYAGKSYGFLKRLPEASVFFECLVSNYPLSPYYADAKNELMKYSRLLTRPPVSEVKHGQEKLTNIVDLTNVIIYSNTENGPFTNFITNILTNNVINSNILTSDTNAEIIKRLSDENKKKKEEIQRYMELIDLKAKLLDLKEKAIDEKEYILYETNYISNSSQVIGTNGTNR